MAGERGCPQLAGRKAMDTENVGGSTRTSRECHRLCRKPGSISCPAGAEPGGNASGMDPPPKVVAGESLISGADVGPSRLGTFRFGREMEGDGAATNGKILLGSIARLQNRKVAPVEAESF
jgi:hypothetical protein